MEIYQHPEKENPSSLPSIRTNNKKGGKRNDDIKKASNADMIHEEGSQAWVRLNNDTMECEGENSIPQGSYLLLRQVKFNPHRIPLHKPVFILINKGGTEYRFCAIVTFINLVHNAIRCEILKPNNPSFWVPLHEIDAIFSVEEVSRERPSQ